MNLKIKLFLIGINTLFFSLINQEIYSWGFFAHKKINQYAVYSLPIEMKNFYKYYIKYLSESSVAPDKKRYLIKGEDKKHFIDLDKYKDTSIKIRYLSWSKAIKKYTKEVLFENGILPWNILSMIDDLTLAFKKRDVDNILKISSHLGHYLSDANVPLHTNSNYDGQYTNQLGIHALWESRIPELFFKTFDLCIGQAEYIKDISMHIWETVIKSNFLSKILLNKEKKFRKNFSKFRLYSLERKKGKIKKEFSKEYCLKLNQLLKNQVEIQFRSSIKMVADIWYTAWVNAQKPNLDELIYLKKKNYLTKELEETHEIENLTITKVRDCCS